MFFWVAEFIGYSSDAVPTVSKNSEDEQEALTLIIFMTGIYVWRATPLIERNDRENIEIVFGSVDSS
jgi:choline-glycine betaine transporter